MPGHLGNDFGEDQNHQRRDRDSSQTAPMPERSAIITISEEYATLTDVVADQGRAEKTLGVFAQEARGPRAKAAGAQPAHRKNAVEGGEGGLHPQRNRRWRRTSAGRRPRRMHVSRQHLDLHPATAIFGRAAQERVSGGGDNRKHKSRLKRGRLRFHHGVEAMGDGRRPCPGRQTDKPRGKRVRISSSRHGSLERQRGALTVGTDETARARAWCRRTSG